MEPKIYFLLNFSNFSLAFLTIFFSLFISLSLFFGLSRRAHSPASMILHKKMIHLKSLYFFVLTCLKCLRRLWHDKLVVDLRKAQQWYETFAASLLGCKPVVNYKGASKPRTTARENDHEARLMTDVVSEQLDLEKATIQQYVSQN